MRLKIKILILLLPIKAYQFVLAQNKSEKRGVSQNGFSYVEEVKSLEPGVSWYYNWANTPNSTEEKFFTHDTDILFYPMCWNANFNETAIRNYLSANPRVKFLLGFNEPNFKAQANMTPAQAAAKWPVLERIAEDYNLELVAPALNYSPDAPYHNPIDWYDEFFEIYPEAKVDYLALHCYMITSDAMMSYIDNIAGRYKKRVWLTEFCAWDDLSKDPVVARKTQIDEMVRKVEALELSDNVAKYSWFKAKGSDTYPYYSLLKYKNDAQGIEAGTLTELGKIYVNMSSFDLSFYYKTEGRIPATNYVRSGFITVEENSDVESDNILQIGNFSSGRSLEYLVETDAEGEYLLTIRTACVDEPFLPVIDVYSDDSKVATINPESTLDMDQWKNQSFKINLPKGKQRLILRSRKSTTIKINWISLDADLASSLQYDYINKSWSKHYDLISLSNMARECSIYSPAGYLVKREYNVECMSVAEIKRGAYILKITMDDGKVIADKLIL